jgi:hypothetical protein
MLLNTVLDCEDLMNTHTFLIFVAAVVLRLILSAARQARTFSHRVVGHVFRKLWFGLIALVLSSCATESRFVMLDKSYPPKPETAEIELVREELPARPFVRISRLDVHLERTHFLGSSLADALPELKKQARQSGADAIIEIQERRSMIGETRIYHVTATGIKYTE